MRSLACYFSLILIIVISAGCSEKRRRLPLPPTTGADTVGGNRNVISLPRRPQLEIEPNNEASKATPIRVGEIHGTIDVPTRKGRRLVPDYDWYALQIPNGPPRNLSLRLSAVKGVDLILQIMHHQRKRPFMTANNLRKGGEELIPNYTTSGGTIYIRIRAGRGWRRQKEKSPTYRLLIDLKPQPADFETEPNEPPTVATPLMLNKPLRGYLSDIRDRDWFVYRPKDNNQQRRLKLQVDPIPGVPMTLLVVTRLRPRLQVRIPLSRVPFVLDSLGALPHEEALYFTLRPRSRKLQINSAYKISLLASTVGENVELEPNDYVERATVLKPDQPLVGRIDYPFDIDRYQLKVDSAKIAVVTVSAVPYLDLKLYFGRRKAVGPVINEGGLGAGEQITNHYLTPGTHYLAVRAKAGQFKPGQQYTLTLKLLDPGQYEREPNDHLKTAMPIAIGSVVNGYIHRRADEDNYRLDLRSNKTSRLVRIQLTGVDGINLTLLVSDKSNTLITRREGITARKKGSVLIRLKPALYFIKIADGARSSANMKLTYQLVVK